MVVVTIWPNNVDKMVKSPHYSRDPGGTPYYIFIILRNFPDVGVGLRLNNSKLYSTMFSKLGQALYTFIHPLYDTINNNRLIAPALLFAPTYLVAVLHSSDVDYPDARLFPWEKPFGVPDDGAS